MMQTKLYDINRRLPFILSTTGHSAHENFSTSNDMSKNLEYFVRTT